jgi:pyruvate dehydrogenase E2 component (dihydrolipoamide acetyltransferase)/2-oxoglutarate dehydrogenase E2 component (dihydrolipoamide succinyltransferase)
MAHDVIMPMLGMVQDTGIIVSWHKQIGDAVKASDVLMEVETDKATVEIEAGFDGFVTALRAETGVPVPVGQVVAVISDDKGDVETTPAATAEAPAAARAEESTAPASAPAEQKPEKPAAAPAPPPRQQGRARGGRVLASPKARRMAEERGIDLGRLARLGVPEPIHVADLDKAGAAAFAAPAASLMRVTIARAPFESFREWVADEAGVDIDGTNLWAAFAAGSLRAATGRSRDEEIVVEASRFAEANGAVALRSPDCAGLSGLKTEPVSSSAALTILDLTETLLTDYRPAGDGQLPHLTICKGQDSANFDLYLAFDPASLAAETAYAFLKELADRTQVPLRHLL